MKTRTYLSFVLLLSLFGCGVFSGDVSTKIGFPMVEARDSLVWMTIKLGTYKDVESLKKALEEGCFTEPGETVYDAIDNHAFRLATREVEVDLAIRSVAELGFKDSARYDEVVARAREQGLELCPPEVGPQLRLQYRDQPFAESLLIAMDAIDYSGSGFGPYLFNVFRKSTLLEDGTIVVEDRPLILGVSPGRPHHVILAGGKFVFIVPR